MEAYTGFAKVYDLFMDDTPYKMWSRYIHETLKRMGILDGLVLDLGCGTGKLTECFASLGYDMIGIDSSVEMLEIAAKRKGVSKLDILYLSQDMREFELYGTVRAVVSTCDCVNYMIEEDLFQVFKLVNNYLDPKGLFFFDFNTEYKYKNLLGNQIFAENRPEGSFIWDNFYDEEEQVNEYDLTLYIKEKEGCYSRYEESHYQIAYTLDTIKSLLEKAGLEFVEAFDDYSKNPATRTSGRICVIAQEKGKLR